MATYPGRPSPYPDLPTTETVQAQGPSQQAVAGTAYQTIEYIEVVQGLPVGPPGPAGPAGPEGEAGGVWHTGVGDPNGNGTAAESLNDMYLDDATGNVWEWNGATWVNTGTNILGPTGPQGVQGPVGSVGPVGPTGPQGAGLSILGTYPGPGGTAPPITGTEAPGDAWINDGDGHLWVWDGAGWVDAGPVIGPTGPAGPAGPVGAIGPTGATGPTGAAAFVVGLNLTPAVDPMYVHQTVTHALSNPYPLVRVIIDIAGNGIFSSDETVAVTYTNATTVEITANASFPAIYNGVRGRVVLQ